MKRKLTKITTCSSSSGKKRFRDKTWDLAMELNLSSSVQFKGKNLKKIILNYSVSYI